MTFKEIFKNKVKDGDFLWRYIDVHKLIDLISTKEMHFTRTDKFSDPFESVTYKLIADRYFARKSKMTNSRIDQNVRDRHNQANKITLEKYEKESLIKQKTQFINCWLRSQRESMAMWNLYSNRDSVAIKVNPSELINYFDNYLESNPDLHPNHKFICGSIKYLKLNPLDPFEKKKLPNYSSFKKDVAYDFEKEFRLLIATPTSFADKNPQFIRLKLGNEFFQFCKIICHPEMENWKYENVKFLCKSFNLTEPTRSKIEIRKFK